GARVRASSASFTQATAPRAFFFRAGINRVSLESFPLTAPFAGQGGRLSPDKERVMTDDRDGGLDRRQSLKCMLWAGTGVGWTFAGGVPSSRLIGPAKAGTSGFSFVQISDSHIGFAKPANPDARLTLNAAIDKVMGLPDKPAFMIHTGDVSHTAKPTEFD